jgi:hypothetical protein
VRRLTTRTFVVLCALALGTAGCRRDEKIKIEETDESAPTIASMVHAADPKAALQLTRGFHAVEQNSWRSVRPIAEPGSRQRCRCPMRFFKR